MEQLNVQTLVIGAGPGGYVAAIRLGQLGQKVLVVEKEKNLGGVCLNWGCIPSKSLIQMAKSYENTIVKNKKMGIIAHKVEIDWEQTQKWKDKTVRSLTGGIAQLLKGNGVSHLEGIAKLTSPHQAQVTNSKGEIFEVNFEHAILATGSSPIEIPGFSFDHKNILDSTDLLELKSIPKSMILIGGGVIGLELGTVYAKLGTKVKVIEMMDQLLPGTSKDVAKVVEDKFRKYQSDVFLSARAKSWKEAGDQVELVFEHEGNNKRVVADFICLAVGRKPNSQGWGAENIGLAIDERGFVMVNDCLQTNHPHIYAIGDVVGQPMLAHKASKEGEMAAENICGAHYSTEDIQTVPGVIFTDPEVAIAGITEDEALAEGLSIKVGKFPYAASGRAKSTNETEGFVKIIADTEEVVRGVEIVGSHASDLISEAALAIEMSALLDDIALTTHPHPTLGELMMEAAKVAKGEPVHILPPKE